MARLIVNPDTPQAWTLELSPGNYAVGRGEGNHVVLEHDSVSSSHCTIAVSEDQLSLQDTGSTGGTWVSGELVESARLTPGAVFRVGQVEIRFESDRPETAAPIPGATVSRETRSGGTCHAHPRVRARFHCVRCNLDFCDFCVETRMSGGVAAKLCRKCGSPCQPLALPPRARAEAVHPSFARLLPGAFVYPFRGSGVILLVAGAVFFLVLGMLPIIGLLITGYLFSYAKRIVAASATGEDDPPDWPDFTNWYDDILAPYGHLIALVVLTFGPSVLLGIFLPKTAAWSEALVMAAIVAGAFLAPMAMLALAMFDTVAALNPAALILSIARIPGHYIVGAVAFGLVIGAYMVTDATIEAVFPVPFLGSLVAGFVNLYLVAVAMRILGLLYRCKKDALGWFSPGLGQLGR